MVLGTRTMEPAIYNLTYIFIRVSASRIGDPHY